MPQSLSGLPERKLDRRCRAHAHPCTVPLTTADEVIGKGNLSPIDYEQPPDKVLLAA
jgi:hypothetical protein